MGTNYDSDTSMLGNVDTQSFMARYWQNEALVMRNVFAEIDDHIQGNDLAALSCMEDVDSRIVIVDEQKRYRCEHGPFAETRFAQLPQRDWTLLVQGVDRYEESVADILAHFSFLPHWRLDDVMVSYAVPGGGVGPHFDYYDVFLIQVAGHRHWQIGERCDANTPLIEDAELRLLESFTRQAEYELVPGDVLYIPPGVAHWGTAVSDECITYSVGFRAPSHADIIQEAAATLSENHLAHKRFKDTPASLDADRYLINAAAKTELQALWNSLEPEAMYNALLQAFGRQVTETSIMATQPCRPLDPAAFEALISQKGRITVKHNALCRFAYSLVDDEALLFVDGESHRACAAFAKGICHGRLDHNALAGQRERDLLLTLALRAVVYIEQTPDGETQ